MIQTSFIRDKERREERGKEKREGEGRRQTEGHRERTYCGSNQDWQLKFYP